MPSTCSRGTQVSTCGQHRVYIAYITRLSTERGPFNLAASLVSPWADQSTKRRQRTVPAEDSVPRSASKSPHRWNMQRCIVYFCQNTSVNLARGSRFAVSLRRPWQLSDSGYLWDFCGYFLCKHRPRFREDPELPLWTRWWRTPSPRSSRFRGNCGRRNTRAWFLQFLLRRSNVTVTLGIFTNIFFVNIAFLRNFSRGHNGGEWLEEMLILWKPRIYFLYFWQKGSLNPLDSIMEDFVIISNLLMRQI